MKQPKYLNFNPLKISHYRSIRSFPDLKVTDPVLYSSGELSVRIHDPQILFLRSHLFYPQITSSKICTLSWLFSHHHRASLEKYDPVLLFIFYWPKRTRVAGSSFNIPFTCFQWLKPLVIVFEFTYSWISDEVTRTFIIIYGEIFGKKCIGERRVSKILKMTLRTIWME